MSQWAYLVVFVQQGRPTFANGAWLGRIDPRAPDALKSCPDLSRYLDEQGAEGWELVAAAPTTVTEPQAGVRGVATTLYLKRPRSG